MRIDDFYTDFSQEEERKLFEQVLLEFQADNNLPDTFNERKSTYRLLHLARSMVIGVDPLPSRQTLGGKALGRYAVACENIERAHLLGCMLWLYGKQVNYGLFKAGSRHDGVAIAQQMEQVMKR
ncbi:hypothetical protein PPTG_11886 [Phytophthora nicotianae INRA-310]|uniref:Uncharacterized protein n=1 Tax=Phytophthora nicotianae (strain INRA-310) TaxID=761204 RepID=W2Q8M0_PHYN3|nr:hypothetical protein PPTG_11886 [Phytophthora nicotianae INRA-310]ETN09513.1 hypothetical protein PPTG_11886 [Phytophthora nicotianae INRA-310]